MRTTKQITTNRRFKIRNSHSAAARDLQFSRSISFSGCKYRTKYVYDEAGNRITKSRDGITVSYTHSNGCNRLTGWTATSTNDFLALRSLDIRGESSEAIGTNAAYGQLWVSNLVVATPSVAGLSFALTNMAVSLGTQTFVAAIGDSAGNVTTTSTNIVVAVTTNAAYSYNAAGCVTNIHTAGPGFVWDLNCGWDAQYRLVSAATNGTAIERYGYGPGGERVWTWTPEGGTNWHMYTGDQVVADLNATGAIVRTYVYGPGIDNILAMTTYGGTTNTYYFLKDHLGSVHAIVNSTGQIMESYCYDAWGTVLGIYDQNSMPLRESAVGNRFLWQGREYSYKTGLYYFRARWEDPVTGRWLSPDPIGIAGGFNQYVFCANNPVNFIDPSGLYSLYADMADTATAGWARGGISGRVQGNFYSGVTALLDTIGGQGVQSTAANSGAAAGRGDYRGAVAWGGATVGLVAMNASTFAFPKGAVVNSGQYLKNPILYDIGSGVLPQSVFRNIAHLSPVERGTYLLENYNAWKRALLPLRASPLDYLAVLGQGPTTGGLFGALGLNLYLNQNADHDGNCK